MFPGALFYQFVYTEGLFFLLLMLVWMGLERERYGWVTAGAFLLPMTRAIGLFCLLPIAWHLVTRRPSGWMKRLGTERWDHARGYEPAMADRGNLLGYGMLMAPLAGWAVYLCLMWHWTGDPFDGFAAQRYWGRGRALGSVLGMSLALQVWLLWRFVNFHWAG